MYEIHRKPNNKLNVYVCEYKLYLPGIHFLAVRMGSELRP